MKKRKLTCPVCRNGIAKRWRMPINRSIWDALKTLYPEQIEERRRGLFADTHGDSKEGADRDSAVAPVATSAEIVLKSSAGAAAAATTSSSSATSNIEASASATAVTNSDYVICRGCGGRVSFNKKGLHYRFCEAFQLLPLKDRKSKRTAKPKPKATFQAPSSVVVPALETSAFGNGFQILTDVSDTRKQIGARDSTAILHLPRGFTHLANMELKRLHKLGKPLRYFHPGILKRMATLDERAQGMAAVAAPGDNCVRLEVLTTLKESWEGGEEEGGWGCMIA